jgi:hypothetical protein
MTIYVVTKVRKGLSADGSHRHIQRVCVETETHYPRQEVADSINARNSWMSKAGAYEATIATRSYCPQSACLATPYIKTNPDSTKKDHLENLDAC